MSKPLVIVGAGSAGAVIAARVSEDSRREVVLVEAGPDYPAELPADLRDGSRNSTRHHDWGYLFDPNVSHDLAPLPRGKVTGGSSAVNTCIALRGQPYDFDEWAERHGAQWSWEACLPAFKRLETDLDIDNAWHGQSGPIRIRRHPPQELVPMQAAFLEAAEAAGHPRCADHNDPTTTGAGPHAMNKVNGIRVSTAMGYLSEARGRDNLRIEANTLVTRVRFAGRRAVGIEVERADGSLETLEASQVVLAAGVIATPGILMRSGIGPRALLEKMGVALRVDAPVGERLLDHPGAAMVLVPEPGFASGRHPIIQATLRYPDRDAELERRNEMQIQPISFIDLPGVPLLTAISVVVGKPAGHGRLWYESADPHAKPRIVSRVGEHPEDRAKLREALRRARAIASQPPLAEAVTIAWPSEEQLAREETTWMLSGIGSGYHPCGSAPMGSVVDGFGRVIGVDDLFVADGSIMPTIPSSNLNLPTIMIGERFGEWLSDGTL